MGYRGKKFLCALGVGILLFLCSVRTGQAAGLEYSGLGSRPIALGGAFTAIADQWTAIYWNPAGLAQLRRRGLGFDNVTFSHIFTDTNSVNNFDPSELRPINLFQGDIFPRIYSSEPDRFRDKHSRATALNPGIGAWWEISDGWVIGGGTFIPLGSGIFWKDAITDSTGALIQADYTNFMLMDVTNISVARRMSDKLYVGIGANLIIAFNKLRVEKRYDGSTINPDYIFRNDAKSKGWGLEAEVGIIYKLHPRLTVGALYKSGARVDMEGKAKFINTAWGIFERSDFHQNLFAPERYGAGIAYKITPKWTISADWHETDWTNFIRNVNFEKYGMVALQDLDLNLEWKKSTRISAGTEYNFNNEWTFRGGWYYDEAAVPAKSNGLTGIVDVSYNWIAFGLGCIKGKWEMDFDVMIMGGDRREDGIRYSLVQSLFSIAFTRNF